MPETISSLGFAVDTSQLLAFNDVLDRMSVQARQTDSAVKRLLGSFDSTARRVDAVQSITRTTVNQFQRLSSSARSSGDALQRSSSSGQEWFRALQAGNGVARQAAQGANQLQTFTAAAARALQGGASAGQQWIQSLNAVAAANRSAAASASVLAASAAPVAAASAAQAQAFAGIGSGARQAASGLGAAAGAGATTAASMQASAAASAFFSGGLQSLGARAVRTAVSMRDLNNRLISFQGLIAATGVGLAVRALAGYADELTNIRARLSLVVDSQEDVASTFDAIFESAQRSGLAVSSTAELFTRVARFGPELGRSNEEILEFTENINRIAVIGGAGVQEANNAIRQLSQGLASGTLRGEEFNSVSEQLPGILQFVAREMGVTTGSLRTLAAQGKITSDILLNAVLNSTEQLVEEFGQLGAVASREAQRLANSFGNVIGNITIDSGLQQSFIDTLTDIRDAVESSGFQNAVQAVFSGVSVAIDAVSFTVTTLLKNLDLLGVAIAGLAARRIAGLFGSVAGAIAGIVTGAKAAVAAVGTLSVALRAGTISAAVFTGAMSAISLPLVAIGAAVGVGVLALRSLRGETEQIDTPASRLRDRISEISGEAEKAANPIRALREQYQQLSDAIQESQTERARLDVAADRAVQASGGSGLAEAVGAGSLPLAFSLTGGDVELGLAREAGEATKAVNELSDAQDEAAEKLRQVGAELQRTARDVFDAVRAYRSLAEITGAQVISPDQAETGILPVTSVVDARQSAANFALQPQVEQFRQALELQRAVASEEARIRRQYAQGSRELDVQLRLLEIRNELIEDGATNASASNVALNFEPAVRSEINTERLASQNALIAQANAALSDQRAITDQIITLEGQSEAVRNRRLETLRRERELLRGGDVADEAGARAVAGVEGTVAEQEAVNEALLRADTLQQQYNTRISQARDLIGLSAGARQAEAAAQQISIQFEGISNELVQQRVAALQASARELAIIQAAEQRISSIRSARQSVANDLETAQAEVDLAARSVAERETELELLRVRQSLIQQGTGAAAAQRIADSLRGQVSQTQALRAELERVRAVQASINALQASGAQLQAVRQAGGADSVELRAELRLIEEINRLREQGVSLTREQEEAERSRLVAIEENARAQQTATNQAQAVKAAQDALAIAQSEREVAGQTLAIRQVELGVLRARQALISGGATPTEADELELKIRPILDAQALAEQRAAIEATIRGIGDAGAADQLRLNALRLAPGIRGQELRVVAAVNSLAQRGIAVTQEQIDTIRSEEAARQPVLDAIDRQIELTRRLERASERAATAITDGLADAVIGGESFLDVLQDVTQQISRITFDTLVGAPLQRQLTDTFNTTGFGLFGQAQQAAQPQAANQNAEQATQALVPLGEAARQVTAEKLVETAAVVTGTAAKQVEGASTVTVTAALSALAAAATSASAALASVAASQTASTAANFVPAFFHTGHDGRSIPPNLGAGGLGANEFPAILERTEAVIPTRGGVVQATRTERGEVVARLPNGASVPIAINDDLPRFHTGYAPSTAPGNFSPNINVMAPQQSGRNTSVSITQNFEGGGDNSPRSRQTRRQAARQMAEQIRRTA